MELLHESNPAGQALLRLTARGNAIIAELLRLAQNVPRGAFRVGNVVLVVVVVVVVAVAAACRHVVAHHVWPVWSVC